MVLVSGGAALRTWNRDTEQHSTQQSLASIRPQWLVRFVSVTTIASAGILVIVVFHALTH
jgi:hypothetical protein